MNNTILNSYSGIKTHQFGLDSVSNNIANVNTTGYKESTPEFKSLLGQHLETTNNSTVSSDINYGTTVGSNAISTKSGDLKKTDGDLDLAYIGKGWFIVGKDPQSTLNINSQDPNLDNQAYFTRDGTFMQDADGNIVTQSGYHVYGVDLGKIKGEVFTDDSIQEDEKKLAGGEIKALRIPKDLVYQPTQSGRLEVRLNLNANTTSAPLGDYLVLEDGSLDTKKLEDLDLNVLFNSEKKPFDAHTNNDILLTVKTLKDGKEETQNLVFKYGYGGVEKNEFQTFSQLKTLFEQKAGLSLDIAKNSNNQPNLPLALEIKNISQDSSENKTITLGGLFSDNLGFSLNGARMQADSSYSGKPLYIASYVSKANIYNEDGRALTVQTRYFLNQSANKNQGVNQKWETRSAIYQGENRLNSREVYSSLEFDDKGEAVQSSINLDYKDKVITYSYTGALGQKSTNSNYKESGVIQSDTDGKAAGKLVGFRVDEDGVIELNFDNGVTSPMGRIGIAVFNNDQGLKNVGGNLFTMTQGRGADGNVKALSGNPIAGWDQDRGKLRFGKMFQGYLENSNTDVANALTSLILMQRGYSMNAKAFSTGDELIKEAINLKRN